MRRAPPGWDSVTALSIRPIARAVLDVAARSEDLPPQVTQIAGMVLSVLADHELEHLVFAGGFASRTYTQRVIW